MLTAELACNLASRLTAARAKELWRGNSVFAYNALSICEEMPVFYAKVVPFYYYTRRSGGIGGKTPRIFNRGTNRGLVVSFTPWPSYPRRNAVYCGVFRFHKFCLCLFPLGD